METLEVKIAQTSENIKSVQLKWGLENKSCAIVCDNAPNMVKAVTSLKREYLVRCAAHSVQLSVNARLQYDSVEELMHNLRKIVGHFHRSSVLQTTLEKEQMKYQLPKQQINSRLHNKMEFDS